MKKVVLLAVSWAWLVVGCTETSGEEQGVDYNALQELSAEVVLEAGASGDYIPGRIRDVAVMEDGSILLFDQQTVTIEQFSPTGEHLGTVAREGGGPGELERYLSLYPTLGKDTLLTRSLTSNRHDLFVPDQEGFYRHIATRMPSENDRSLQLVGNRTPTEYYALESGFSMENYEAPFRKTVVAVVNAKEEIIRDSLHILTATNDYVERSENSIRLYTISLYKFSDRFKLLDHGNYLIARPDSSLITYYNKDHEVTRQLDLTIRPRQLTDDDLDYFLSNYPADARNEIESRLRDVKPPFIDLWATSNHLVLFVDESDAGKEFVVISNEGEPVGRFNLPAIDDVQQVVDNRIYTIHRDSLAGDMIRAYEFGIGD